MKLAVEFPNVVYREGPAGIAALGRAIEQIGFDQIDLFDHVVMGNLKEGRRTGPYPSAMPILEALTTLAYLAAVTERVGLGTEVLVLPQRQATLVAKQVSTLDTLSGGRVRLGVGVGWQESEYNALGVNFRQRGAVMDEAIRYLRSCWGAASISFSGKHIQADAIAMEPKPPQGGAIPIWVGGNSARALRRAGTLGDGWLGSASAGDLPAAKQSIATVRRHSEEAGRDPSLLGFQAQISPPPRPDDPSSRTFYADAAQVAAVAIAMREAGFGWATLNVTGVFLAGARSGEAMAEALQALHDRLRRRWDGTSRGLERIHRAPPACAPSRASRPSPLSRRLA